VSRPHRKEALAMQTFAKKRIEVFIEAPLLRRVTELLDQAQISGYTVMPLLGGRGHDGAWSAEGQIGSAAQMVGLICIVDEGRADALLETLFAVISHQIGMVTISDVAVIRRERF
jgi:nitrogen regulatory protein PII